MFPLPTSWDIETYDFPQSSLHFPYNLRIFGILNKIPPPPPVKYHIEKLRDIWLYLNEEEIAIPSPLLTLSLVKGVKLTFHLKLVFQ